MDYRNGSRPTSNEYGNAHLLTPSDTANQPNIYPAYKIGATGGALVCTPADAPDGTQITLNVAANEVLKVALKRIFSTGTVATTIHGLF